MIEFKTPSDIADEYLLHLKSLKPEVNVAQQDSDWWVRAQTVGGTFSGIYADQRKIADDAFPQSARREALERHLNMHFDEGFKPATQAQGNVIAVGPGTVTEGTQFIYEPNGNVYLAEEDTVVGATGLVPVKSVGTGQNQNLLSGTVLSLPSAPSGIGSTATVDSGHISDGRDEESNEQAAARILLEVRTPLAGGKVSDYVQFARDADPSVVDANVIRFPFGFGTIAIVITAGTADIDEALDNGDPVVVTPSQELIDSVQEYVDSQKIVTDCVSVVGPNEVPIDVTANVRFASGTKDTILSGQTLTQGELVEREIKRAIYKTPPGGRQLGGSGFVVASEIEEVMDFNLSANPYTVGNLAEILVDRQIEDLAASGANRMILGNEVAVPGTITIVELT